MQTELLPGDLILVRGDSLIAKGIEAVTDSAYSHVAGVYRGTTLIEAQGFRRTGCIDASAYAGCADVYRFQYPLPIKKRDKVLNYAENGVGGRYDYLLIVWELCRYLLHLTFPISEGNKRICSTFWARAYRKAGVDLCKGIRYPTPGDIAVSPYLKKVGTI